MTQQERRTFLINYLKNERTDRQNIIIPNDEHEQKKLLRSLLNVRFPESISDEFIKIENEYLQEEQKNKKIISIEHLSPVESHIYLWQGDITTLAVDGIVNAANSRMIGCFVPCHACIDNVIHSCAGIELRLACFEMMEKQGVPEETGKAKMTKAYNLPSKYILHTVGPIIQNDITEQDCQLLASCYQSCLTLAIENNLRSIAFCCISTGEFHFPNDKAAEIAIQTVRRFLVHNDSKLEVIFNVFKNEDYKLYQQMLGSN